MRVCHTKALLDLDSRELSSDHAELHLLSQENTRFLIKSLWNRTWAEQGGISLLPNQTKLHILKKQRALFIESSLSQIPRLKQKKIVFRSCRTLPTVTAKHKTFTKSLQNRTWAEQGGVGHRALPNQTKLHILKKQRAVFIESLPNQIPLRLRQSSDHAELHLLSHQNNDILT